MSPRINGVPLPSSAYLASLSAFADYAGLGDGVPRNPVAALQVRLHRWAVANFPGETDDQAALGIAEELAELAAALELPAGLGYNTAVRDAIGDVLIYATKLCTSYRLDVDALLEAAGAHPNAAHADVVHEALRGLGQVARARIKSAYKIRGYGDPALCRRLIADGLWTVIRAMRNEAEDHGWLIEEIFAQVAEQVMARNWVANPASGVV